MRVYVRRDNIVDQWPPSDEQTFCSHREMTVQPGVPAWVLRSQLKAPLKRCFPAQVVQSTEVHQRSAAEVTRR